MNRRIVQLALVGAVFLVASAQARANVAYLGGRVIPSVRIVPIFYGDWSSPNLLGARIYLTELTDYVRGAKNPAGKQPLYAQYGVTNAFVNEFPCSSCFDRNSRTLSNSELENIIHGVQAQNNVPYAPDTVFLLLLDPTFSTSAGNCGYAGNEGDGRYYVAMSRQCGPFEETISRRVLGTATSANPAAPGWADVIGPCPGHTWSFGRGNIALPWNNHLGACPPLGSDPNIPFDAKQGEVLQVLVSTASGGLFHTIRYPTFWTPFGDVKGAVGSDPGFIGNVDAQATLGVFNHVIATAAGKLWHTIRTDTAWTPWVDVNAATGAASTTFSNVGLANVEGDLHVCATTSSGGVQHAIRFRNGTWTGFGDVLGQTGSPGSPVIDVDCAGLGSEMHILMSTNTGGLFHSIRLASGWSPLGDVKGAAGQIGAARQVSAALFASDLHVTARITGGTQFHALRHNAGGWVPFATPPNNIFVQDNASAGAADFLHLVSIENGVVKHRTRDAFANWSPVGNVNAAAGNSPGQASSVSAATSIGY